MSADPSSILPPLTPEQAEHCERVRAAVRAAVIDRGGWLAFDDYLQLVLYAPGLGYYSAGSAKFGPEGDFVTAPEISTLFGRCLARQCAQILAAGGEQIVEFGAGSGALAASLLPKLAELGVLPRRYAIIEVSADLRERQRARLSQLPASLRDCVQWLDTLPTTPIEGVMIANEVADALPFRRFRVSDEGPQEIGVSLAEQALCEAVRPADETLRPALQRLDRAWSIGYESEWRPLLAPWLKSISAALGRGAMLLIDYGLPQHEYYHPDRIRGTWRCYFRHRAHEEALRYPGLQDITAWVDFTAVAEAASDAGLEVAGYCTQAAFLLATGIEEDLASVDSVREQTRLAGEARKLLLPGEMGEHFKVMTLTRGLELTLRGAALQDLRHTL